MINSGAGQWLVQCGDDKSWVQPGAAVPVSGAKHAHTSQFTAEFPTSSIYLITSIWCEQWLYFWYFRGTTTVRNYTDKTYFSLSLLKQLSRSDVV